MHETLRDRLRQETRTDHETLDRLISTLDVATRSGFARFCQVHLSAFFAMSQRSHPDPLTASLLFRACAALSDDLDRLTRETISIPNGLKDEIDPLAVAYVIGGSRLGSKILKARWSRTTDPVVKAADHYFSMPSEGAYWTSVCAQLAQFAPDDPRAQQIIRDTRTIFRMFVATFHAAAEQTALGTTQ